MGVYEIKLPDVGEGVAQAELVEWFVEAGAFVRADDLLAGVMTDKATVEIASPVDGKVIWRAGAVGETLAVGAPLIRLEVEGAGNQDDRANDQETSPKQTPPLKETPREQTPKQDPRPVVLAPPAVRARAKALGVDLAAINGSGPEGRVTHQDLDAAINAKTPAPSEKTSDQLSDQAAFQKALDAVRDEGAQALPLTGLRRKIARKMTASMSIAHITYVEEVDVTALEEKRKNLNTGAGENITPLAFLMRAIAIALQDHPKFNGLYNEEEEIFHQARLCNIAIATNSDDGLMTPVARDVGALDLIACAKAARMAAQAARQKNARLDQLTGSTITISSLGALGGIVSTPIINKPEVAIIGVNKIQILPRWDGADFKPRQVMNLSSSFDHRVIDGADGAAFIQRIKALLEAPQNLL